jgi:hypothetical protein
MFRGLTPIASASAFCVLGPATLELPEDMRARGRQPVGAPGRPRERKGEPRRGGKGALAAGTAQSNVVA